MTTASLCRVARLIFLKKRQIFSIAVPLLFLPLVFCSKAARCGYVAINMIIFLITETLPMPIASFLPAIFFPILGIQDAKTVARSYMADAILFLIGVLIIASSVERTNLHKRIALSGLRRVGHNPYRLMLCLMSLSAFLSMWFSNTAVASMMVSIGKAIADQTTSRPGIDSRDEDNEDPLCDLVSAVDDKDRMEMEDIVNHKKAVDDDRTNDEPLPRVVIGKKSSVVGSCLILSIAYGTSIGGSATLTGTVMPIILNAMLTDEYGTSSSIGFDTWISFAFPLQLVCLVFCYLWMCLLLWWLQKRERVTVQREESLRVNTRHTSDSLSNGYLQTYIKNEYAKLGRTKWAEYWSLFIVVSVVILWFFADLKFISGWLSLFKSTRVSITSVTLGFAVLLFIIPLRRPSCTIPDVPKPTRTILDWTYVRHAFPWGVVLVIGGYLALANGIKSSGLGRVLQESFDWLADVDDWVVVLVVTTVVAISTEMISNMGVFVICFPILTVLAKETQTHPWFYLIPLVFSCNLAFMLPVATPVNMIIYSCGNVSILEMARAGVVVNIICLFLTNFFVNTYGYWIFDFKSVPLWAIEEVAMVNITNATAV